jgi:hypothetical protein
MSNVYTCETKIYYALNTRDPEEGLQRLIDSALSEDYPFDSILKVIFTIFAMFVKFLA